MDSNPASSWQDSGYGSQPASPVGQPAKISQKPCHSATDTCDNSRGRLLKELQTYGDIFEFDKPVDDSVISRFQRIQTQIEIPLLNYIHKKRPNKKYSPIAAKVVKKFVNKDNFRALSRPQDQDLPLFDVYVTYLGAPIIVHLPSGADKTITLEDEDSDDWEPVTISMPKHKASPFDISGDSSSSTSSDVSDSDASSSSSDDAISRKTASIYATRKNKLESSHTQKPWMDPALRPLGYISEYSLRPGLPCIKSRYGNPQPYYDWALLDMHEYRRNEIPLRTRGWFHGIFWPEEIDITAPRKISNNRPVFVITGSEGRMRGSLSTLPSRVLLGKSQVFVNAFLLNADNVIKDGDSGSWVVDQETRQVYGYVVATDAFGDAYVDTTSRP
ncbi:hypothetical protein CDD82_2375 [Ophiocordyceps australis]|uniref:Uncharacterized protein n=1 Tax=Ophiocordyceps australis TaxID=1399860 RepID=A0A2C5ZHH3_9HYPO|nr:hypothetical protein CDD82_2375 [Ophiocordyceps australis]